MDQSHRSCLLHTRLLHSRCVFHALESVRLISVPKVLVFKKLKNRNTWKTNSSKEVIPRREQEWGDISPYTFKNWQLVEHNLVNVTDVLLSSSTKAFEIPVSRCSKELRGKFPNLEHTSQRPCCKLATVGLDRVHRLSWSSGPPSNRCDSYCTYFARDFDTSENSGACKRSLLLSGIKLLSGIWYDLRSNVPGYTLYLSWALHAEYSYSSIDVP